MLRQKGLLKRYTSGTSRLSPTVCVQSVSITRDSPVTCRESVATSTAHMHFSSLCHGECYVCLQVQSSRQLGTGSCNLLCDIPVFINIIVMIKLITNNTSIT